MTVRPSPTIVFSGSTIPCLARCGISERSIKNYNFVNTPTGYANSETFFIWSTNTFIKNVNHNKLHLLMLDGHAAHTTFLLIESCIEFNVQLLILPSHAFNYTQALDVGVFKSVKQVFKYYNKNHLHSLNSCKENRIKIKNIINGFATGTSL